ncbi:MAG TPA: C40 family peptidase [Chryseosolibacter sp.]|nr:C40 family peptidase [Chryseosolibacter sp.]
MEIIEHGVCRLSVVSIRTEPTHMSEQVSQLLFGEEYEVTRISDDRKWRQIRTTFDHYEGWIDARQHHGITKEHYEYINRAEFKISLDVTSSLLYNKTSLPIVIGSIIPISGSELFRMEEQFAFNGESKSLGNKREFEFLKTIAFRYLNAPYQWGGKSPFGIDCSGFAQMVFKICGYRLQRDAWQQASQGKAVDSFDERVPGDLAFFRNDHGKIVHTGIVLAENKIIHASGRVRIDTLDARGILNADTRQHSHEFAHLRRILA